MTDATTRYARILTGDPAPIFEQAGLATPRFSLSSTGGRYLVMCFFASAALEGARAALSAAFARHDLFDGRRAAFLGISIDPADRAEARLGDLPLGYDIVWDFDGRASRLYGAIPIEAALAPGTVMARPTWVVLDPTLRVLKVVPFAPSHDDVAEILGFVEALPAPACFAGMDLQAPIIVLPNVFEPDLCRRLVHLYETVGGEESGVMQDIGGKTVGVLNARYKRRRDCTIEDPALVAEIRGRVSRRVVPEIAKIHQFTATRMERYIVACYAAEDGGHFSPHRDNTTRGTAHRRFAVSINLNDDFDGGEVGFPEYGPRTFKAPPGGAVVFSCSLLHAVTTVTRGRRYTFLPFLYDDAAAAIREANLPFVGAADAPAPSLARPLPAPPAPIAPVPSAVAKVAGGVRSSAGMSSRPASPRKRASR